MSTGGGQTDIKSLIAHSHGVLSNAARLANWAICERLIVALTSVILIGRLIKAIATGCRQHTTNL